jgi:hypothetical protein
MLIKMKIVLNITLTTLIFICTNLYAAQESPVGTESNTDLDSILDDFNNDNFENEDTELSIPLSENNNYTLSGHASLGASYNYNHDATGIDITNYWKLAQIPLNLRLELKTKLPNDNWKLFASINIAYDAVYSVLGRQKFTAQEIDLYERETELWETYIQGNLSSNLDFKIGRQIVIWGNADNLRVLDVLNPLDNREPGLIDIEELRLPVTMSKLDYYFTNWHLSTLAIHEIRFNKNPAFGNDFFPYDSPLPFEKKPSNNASSTEYGMALKGGFQGWDIAFHWARFFDDAAHIDPVSLQQQHSKLNLLGSSINIILGNWLIKSELAYIDDLNYFATASVKKSRIDSLLGFEYYGIADTTISLEAVNQHINNYDSAMKNDFDDVKENEKQLAFMYRSDFNHDSLHFLFLATYLGFNGKQGAFQRISLSYDTTDNISLTAGLIFYASGDDIMFRNIEDNDRLFVKAKYSF